MYASIRERNPLLKMINMRNESERWEAVGVKRKSPRELHHRPVFLRNMDSSRSTHDGTRKMS